MKKLFRLFVLIVTASVLLAACGPAATPEVKEPQPVGEQPTEIQSAETQLPENQPTEAQPVAKKDYKIAVIRWDPGDIYFNGVQLGQEMERDRIMQEEGVNIEFNVFGANDAGKQITALQTQVDAGVDGVLLVPWRGEAMIPLVASISEQKLPIVVSNAFVPESKSTFVAFANEDAGRLAGEAIVNRLNELRGEDWPQTGGVIIELRCIITASFDIGRHTGYHAVLDPIVEANPGVVIETREAGCDDAEARKAVDDIITRYGPENVLAVASIDGTMGLGASAAFQAQGIAYPYDDNRHIPITTVDGSQPELVAINRGDIDHASVQPAVGEGIMTMRLLWQMIKEGQLIDKAATESILYEDGTEQWMPVQVIPSSDFDGNWYKTQAYSVPEDVKVDDESLWGNMMYFKDKGVYPTYDGPYGK